MPVGQLLVDGDELHSHQLESPPLEAGRYFADQATLHCVGLDDDQCSLHRSSSLVVSIRAR